MDLSYSEWRPQLAAGLIRQTVRAQDCRGSVTHLNVLPKAASSWPATRALAQDRTGLEGGSGAVLVPMDLMVRGVLSMEDIVGAFQIRRLVRATTGGTRDAMSGVPWKAGQGSTVATGKIRTYGP